MPETTLADVWQGVLGTQPDPPAALVLATAVVAVVVIAFPRAWRVSRNVVTIAHEGGHALAALASGRRLSGIRLHSDTSGVTVSRGRPTGPGMVATLVAGYPTPPLLGLAVAAMLAADRITAPLWIGLALLAGMLVAIRNLFGVVSVVLTGAVVFAVSWFAPAVVQAGFAYLVAWFLLFAGARPVFELQRLRRQGRAPHSDADQLGRLIGIPPFVWVALFAVVAVVALVAGARLLLP
ncbi:MAG TPA: M50 family metallopeptidase [Cryptosporangiaceae bacterium]|nr:M50 family metallopeptidase [Cryptosporangiaceae bacterium]